MAMSLERVQHFLFPPPMAKCQYTCPDDRLITEGTLDPFIQVEGRELTAAAFDAYSHYRPAQRTKYRLTCPPGLRPIDYVGVHVRA